MPVEDEWFEGMVDEDWVMDIDDDIDQLVALNTSESTKSSTEVTIKVADEKEAKPTTRYSL